MICKLTGTEYTSLFSGINPDIYIPIELSFSMTHGLTDDAYKILIANYLYSKGIIKIDQSRGVAPMEFSNPKSEIKAIYALNYVISGNADIKTPSFSTKHPIDVSSSIELMRKKYRAGRCIVKNEYHLSILELNKEIQESKGYPLRTIECLRAFMDLYLNKVNVDDRIRETIHRGMVIALCRKKRLDDLSLNQKKLLTYCIPLFDTAINKREDDTNPIESIERTLFIHTKERYIKCIKEGESLSSPNITIGI